MQVKNGDIWATTTPVGKEPAPLQELLAERWPVKTAYWLARLARKLEGPRRDIHLVRDGLIKQHGSTDEKGTANIKPGDEHWEDFVAAHNELMDQTVEVDINQIMLPALNGCELKPSTLLGVEPFVTVEE